mmetsp:Transcript_43999/g.111302  ORF Transcript_43999/g.111302 Transcript_43999/m.111302 type:complete len:429 (-) Transcript_43999:356-1642(-)
MAGVRGARQRGRCGAGLAAGGRPRRHRVPQRRRVRPPRLPRRPGPGRRVLLPCVQGARHGSAVHQHAAAPRARVPGAGDGRRERRVCGGAAVARGPLHQHLRGALRRGGIRDGQPGDGAVAGDGVAAAAAPLAALCPHVRAVAPAARRARPARPAPAAPRHLLPAPHALRDGRQPAQHAAHQARVPPLLQEAPRVPQPDHATRQRAHRHRDGALVQGGKLAGEGARAPLCGVRHHLAAGVPAVPLLQVHVHLQRAPAAHAVQRRGARHVGDHLGRVEQHAGHLAQAHDAEHGAHAGARAPVARQEDPVRAQVRPAGGPPRHPAPGAQPQPAHPDAVGAPVLPAGKPPPVGSRAPHRLQQQRHGKRMSTTRSAAMITRRPIRTDHPRPRTCPFERTNYSPTPEGISTGSSTSPCAMDFHTVPKKGFRKP